MRSKLLVPIIVTSALVIGGGITLATTSNPSQPAAVQTHAVRKPVKTPAVSKSVKTPAKTTTAPTSTAAPVTPATTVAPSRTTSTVTRSTTAAPPVTVAKPTTTGAASTIPPSAPTTTVTAPPPVVTPTYTAGVDPTFTQNGTNPLAVTFSYSASSNESPLPGGILNLLTPGGTQPTPCSINVGASSPGSTCLVDYPSTGPFSVTTQYIPNGVTAVTSSETITIPSYSTTTTVALTGDASLWTATAAVTDTFGAVPLPYAPWPLSITFTDTTTGSVVYSGRTGPDQQGIFSFYFAAGVLYSHQGNYLSGLARVNEADSFSVSMSYAGGIGFSPSTSAAVAIP